MLTEETIKKAEAILAIMGSKLTRKSETVEFTIKIGSVTVRTDKALMNAVSKVVSGFYEV